MAAPAVGRELAPMLVSVTAAALGRETKPRARKVLYQDSACRGRGDALRPMAGFAGKGSVLSFQRVACPVMVELSHRSVPADQGDIPSIVLRMTGYAGSARPVRSHKRRMQAALFIQPEADLLVALEAFVLWRQCRQIVTVRALGGAAQTAVRPGQGSGRYLSQDRTGCE